MRILGRVRWTTPTVTPFVQSSHCRVLLDHSPPAAASADPPAGAAPIPPAGGDASPCVPPAGGYHGGAT